MSNPARAPKEYTTQQLLLSVAPDSFLPDGFRDYARTHKKVEEVQKVLGKLDMGLAPAIVIPKEYTVAANVLQKNGPSLAQAKTGVPEPRIRSAFAKSLINRAFGKLPEKGIFSKEVVGQAMRSKVYVDAGTEGTLGRLALAYPSVGKAPSRPVTSGEARAALVRCGLTMGHLPSHALRPYPLTPAEGEDGVTVNPNSDNGFPVLGKWSTPGAAAMAMGLATTIRRELQQEGDGEKWLRNNELARPWLVAVRGKAKADYYSQEKVADGRMRFYNAFPRQTMLNMQVATQVLEGNARHINNSDSHSGIGATLVRGGASDMVAALQRQLDERGTAYVHVGDDSWVLIKRGEKLYMFALDCSNFDLTQHGEVTVEVHEALRDELKRVDPLAAGLWYGYARERLVVVTGTQVRRFKHAGPSGMPLQSKINDVLMDVMIDRTLSALKGKDISAVLLADTLAMQGKQMGFVVRLEQYWEGNAENIVDALAQNPFLFIGYYFHARGGGVRVCADVPRTFAQVPFPALKWAKNGRDLQITEAMRLGSISLNLGMPTAELEPAFATFREEAALLIQMTLDRFGEQEDPRLRWAVQESPWGSDTIPSLSGLLAAVKRDAGILWLTKEVELKSTSRLVGLGWADLVELDEQEEAEMARASTARPRGLSVKAVQVRPGKVPTHPASLANDGRPPPTAVWAPNKPPRAQKEDTSGKRLRRRDGMARREFQQELDDYSYSDEDEYDDL